MATKAAEIRELIRAKIEALEDGNGDKYFKAVVGYADGDFSGYPAAAVFPTGGRGKVLDTHRNERTFEIAARLYQEQSEGGKDKEDADAALVASLDAVIEAFDRDRDLGGEVEIVRVVSFEADFQASAGTWNYATVRFEAVCVLPNYQP